jgi:hypothetical protein
LLFDVPTPSVSGGENCSVADSGASERLNPALEKSFHESVSRFARRSCVRTSTLVPITLIPTHRQVKKRRLTALAFSVKSNLSLPSIPPSFGPPCPPNPPPLPLPFPPPPPNPKLSNSPHFKSVKLLNAPASSLAKLLVLDALRLYVLPEV